jgi:hypothetical protein
MPGGVKVDKMRRYFKFALQFIMMETRKQNEVTQYSKSNDTLRYYNMRLLLLILLITPCFSTTLIIGASGAIGTQLTKKLLDNDIQVVAGLRKTPLPAHLTSHPNLTQVFGVDCRNATSINELFSSNPSIDTVWNLAAPLSVETSSDPNLAYDVVVNGMSRILSAMSVHPNAKRILFSDSIGSYGSSSPREGASARWLLDNPTQDPGSDYGRQKRECRELIRDWAAAKGERSSRFAVIPGVLHTDASWGAGTTGETLGESKVLERRVSTKKLTYSARRRVRP